MNTAQRWIGFVGLILIVLRFIFPPMYIKPIYRNLDPVLRDRVTEMDFGVLVLHIVVIAILCGVGMFLMRQKG